MQHPAWIILLLHLLAAADWAQVVGTPRFVPQAGQTGPAAASGVSPEQLAVVAGRVMSAVTGEPIRKAALRLTSFQTPPGPSTAGPAMNVRGMAPGMGGQGYSASSETDGSFRIEGVNPGRYYLSISRTGFLTTNYGAKRPHGPATLIVIAPSQQLTDLSVSMTPQAVISGKVLDADGDPITGGMVQVLAPSWLRGKLRYSARSGNQVNDLGEYRIPNLEPGKYFVFAQKQGYAPAEAENMPKGKPDIRPVRTFFPSSIAFSGATPVDVKAGQDATGVDIRLQSVQTFHVRGQVSGLPNSEGNRERSMISLTPRDDDFVVFNSGQSGLRPDGTFDLPGVAPGSYYLNLFSMAGQIRSSARQAVDVGSSDVDGLVLSVTPPGSMRGVARIQGTPPPNGPGINATSLHLTLQPSEMMGMFGPPPSAKFSPDGTFALGNISPGKYFVQTIPPPGTYLKSIRFGSSEVLGKELDLSGGAGGELEVIFRYGPGEINGQLEMSQNASASPPSQIVAIPEELSADGTGIRTASLDSKGNFAVSGLAPGRYRVYAFEDASVNALQNPDLQKQLESKSPLIEVKEGEKKQVQLSPITRDEFDQISARLGLELP